MSSDWRNLLKANVKNILTNLKLKQSDDFEESLSVPPVECESPQSVPSFEKERANLIRNAVKEVCDQLEDQLQEYFSTQTEAKQLSQMYEKTVLDKCQELFKTVKQMKTDLEAKELYAFFEEFELEVLETFAHIIQQNKEKFSEYYMTLIETKFDAYPEDHIQMVEVPDFERWLTLLQNSILYKVGSLDFGVQLRAFSWIELLESVNKPENFCYSVKLFEDDELIDLAKSIYNSIFSKVEMTREKIR